MQTPMISIPLKETDEVDWIQPLKKYIRDHHSQDPEKYTEECALLQRLRQDMRGAGKDSESSRDLLYRYCGQLEFLDRRFTVDEKNVKISFTWHDAFTQEPTSQYSLAYEKACVIFNIAAVLSCNAAARNREAEDGLKKVWHEFQLAAGMLRYLNENFQYAPSKDLDRSTVSTLDVIMLAQAQEAFFERQVRRKTKVLMVAKLAGYAASLWSQAVEGVQENVDKDIFDKSWLLLVQCKAALFASLAQHYQAMADVSGEKGKVPDYGAQIMRLEVAVRQATEAKNIAKSFPKSCPDNSNLGPETASALVSVTDKHLTAVKEVLEGAKRDNDKIYNQIVPTESSLAAVDTLSSANPTRISKAEIDQIIGADIFRKLVPIWIVQSASVYQSEKDKITRQARSSVEMVQIKLASLLSSTELVSLIDMLSGGASRETFVFKEFKSFCEKVADIPPTSQIVNELARNMNKLKSSLSQISRRLDEEESICEEMRLKHGGRWTQQPSSDMTAMLRKDISSLNTTLTQGVDSDSNVVKECRSFDAMYNDMRLAGSEIVSSGRSEEANTLFQRFLNQAMNSLEDYRDANQTSPDSSSLIDEVFEDRGRSIDQQVKDLDESWKKTKGYERGATETMENIKAQAEQDDIHMELIEDISNKRAISDAHHPLFVERLKQYEDLQTTLLEWIEQFQHELRSTEALYNRLRQDKRIRRDVAKLKAFNVELKRQQGIEPVMKAVSKGINNARKFYTDMQERIENLSQNVETFLNNRESERKDLLQDMQATKAPGHTYPSAERDQARLSELMERMKVSASHPVPPSSHHRPAPLQNIPSYHQTYNPAKSPPLSAGLGQSQHAPLPSPYGVHSQQQRFAPHGRTSSATNFAYNPNHYGPVSPPPGQPNFSHGPSNARGYHSPPPNQQFPPVPAGFVPPPPPPGPPPSNAAQANDNSDPWGGLSGWK